MRLKQYASGELEALPTSELGRLYQKNYLTLSGDANSRSQLEIIVQILKTRPQSEREEVYYSMKNEARAVAKKNGPLKASSLIKLCRYYIEDVMQPNFTDGDRDSNKK